MGGQQKSLKGYRRLLSRQSTMDPSEEKEVKPPRTLPRAASTREAARPPAHPLLKVLAAKNPDKAAMKPEFLRYLAYMREAGTSATTASDT